MAADTFRFDGSDLMPGAVGAGSFWTGIVDYVGGEDLDTILADIDASWPEEVRTALEGKSLVEERCTKCHDLGRVERAKKTEEEWKATVERMVGNGAELNEAEQELVIQYLTETYPK